MQIPPEWVAPILSIIGMIGSLIIFVATRVVAQRERINIAEQVRLYRKTQHENRLIETVTENIRILREIAYVTEGFQNPRSAEERVEFKLRLEQLASTLTQLSWRSGPFTDDVARLAQQAYVTAIGIPAHRRKNIVETADRLSGELADWLKGVLSEEIS